tara:strand:+ start:5765 stop:7201 length:1437 start_codon:yes stop_codon:yes gene_type:complete
MEIGIATGLAQSMDYNNRIADARYQDQQMKRAQAENTAELKAFEDDLDYMNAANSYDYNLIKGEADKTIREIGTIIRDNPDFRYNPDIRRQINEKKKYLKSNQNVIRGMASDESFKRLNDDLAKVAKNPNQYDAGAYQELLAKKQNYLQYGNQDGKEAAEKFGPQAFVYDKPEDFIDLPTTAIEVGNKYRSDKYQQDGNGGYHQLIDDATLRPLAENLYRQRQRQFQVQNGVKTDEEGIQAAADMIRAGIKLERKFGEPNHALIAAQWKRKMEIEDAKGGAGRPIDTYNKMIRDEGSSYPGAENLTKMIGVKPTVKIYDADGNYVKDESGREFIPIGSYVRSNDVTRVKPYMNKEGRMTQYAKGSNKGVGVIHGYSVYSKKEMDELGWLDEPSMKKNIEVSYESGKDKEPVYKLKTQHVFDPEKNQAYAFKLNNAVGETSKQIGEMGDVENIPTREIEYDNQGNMFDAQTKQYLGKSR